MDRTYVLIDYYRSYGCLLLLLFYDVNEYVLNI